MQIVDIPDLEAQEDISRQVAAAPAVRTVSIVDIAELESADLFRLPVVDKDHQVDLSLLTCSLCPADQVLPTSVAVLELQCCFVQSICLLMHTCVLLAIINRQKPCKITKDSATDTPLTFLAETSLMRLAACYCFAVRSPLAAELNYQVHAMISNYILVTFRR